MRHTIPFLMLQCSSEDVLEQKLHLYSCGKNIQIPASKFYTFKAIHLFTCMSGFYYVDGYKEETVWKIPRLCPCMASFSIIPFLSRARKMFLKQSPSLPVFMKSETHIHSSHLLKWGFFFFVTRLCLVYVHFLVFCSQILSGIILIQEKEVWGELIYT